MRYEKASVYLDRKTGVCTIEVMRLHPAGYGSVATGELTEIRAGEFEQRAGEALLVALA